MSPLTATLVFLAGGALIVLAGTVLARSGDAIAAHTNLGGLWVGMIFLAVATSLPELVTDISAIRLGAPDLAAADLFGSSMANMLILALVGMAPRAELFSRAALDNALIASLAIIMTAIACIVLLVAPAAAPLGVGPGSVLLLVVYVAGSRAIFRHSRVLRAAGEQVEQSAPLDESGGPVAAVAHASLGHTALRFGAAALVILLVAPFFAASAERVAELTGAGETFIGTWLVGLATSLPELATSLAAVRVGAYDLAVGNLFGSNAVNMAMFLPLDLAHPGGALLGAVSPTHAISALTALVMMGIALAAIVYRAKKRLSMLEPSAALILAAYVVGLALVFVTSRG